MTELQPYQVRFIDEIHQLHDEIVKLENILEGYRNNSLDFVPTCSYELLNSQYQAMVSYLGILLIRAKIEGLDQYVNLC